MDFVQGLGPLLYDGFKLLPCVGLLPNGIFLEGKVEIPVPDIIIVVVQLEDYAFARHEDVIVKY